MNNKLTKNDSVNVSSNELRELQEQFEAILCEHDVWCDYFHWWAVARDLVGLDEIFTRWGKWTANQYPEYWLSQAFLFESTNIPNIKLSLIDSIWNVWLHKNLNK